MALLSCIIFTEYYYFIGYWIAEIIRSIIEIIFLNNPKKSGKELYSKEDFIVEEELLKLMLLNIADLLTGFLVLYTNYRMKSLEASRNEKKEENKEKKLETSLIYNDISRFKHKVFLIPIISILDFLASSVYLIAVLFSKVILIPRQLDWMQSIDIIVRIFFSICILKINVRKHHKLGIILCIIGFILMSISDIISLKNMNNSTDTLIFIMIIFPKCFLFPLGDVLYKIVLTNDFLLPHTLMFYRGVSQCWVFFIIVPILYWKKKLDFEFLNKIKNYKRIIHCIFFTIISCVRNLFVLKVIYIFNSHYVSFLHAIIIFENTIKQIFEEDKIYNFKEIKGILYFIVDLLALFIISWGTLIFNEMIIINACGLNEKTKQSLINEEQNENFLNCESVYYEEEEHEENDSNNNEKDNSNEKGNSNEKESFLIEKIPTDSNESNDTF